MLVIKDFMADTTGSTLIPTHSFLNVLSQLIKVHVWFVATNTQKFLFLKINQHYKIIIFGYGAAHDKMMLELIISEKIFIAASSQTAERTY